MSHRRRLERKLLKKEKAYETGQLMKEKRSEEYEVLEQVFDRSTLMTIYDFLNKGVIDHIYGVVKEGKEARIYWGKDKDKKELAIKIYLTISAEFKKGKLPYIEGDPRFVNIRRDSRSLVFAWARKEYSNLELAYKAKIMVPKPIAVRNNVLIMEFIGKNGVPAPIMKDVPPKNPERTYRQLFSYVKRLYRKAKLVHGDLSEYNVMVWRGNAVLFDVAQAVPLEHPMSKYFLKRDLENFYRYFNKLGVDVLSVEKMFKEITGGDES